LVREQLAEQTVRAATADRVKAQLFNNLSHELRTPLSAIIGFADLLRSDARPDQQAALSHIQSGGKRLLATLDNLIDLTQIEDRKLRSRPLDLMATLTQAVEASRPFATEKQIALVMAVPDAILPPVVADSWALRRIIDNLLANGIKFTEPGGSVEVSTQRMPDGVGIAVTDTGAGMPPDVLEQIGEPFFQADSGLARRFEGMGTGLALSLRLADAMGARLRFDSTPGEGTIASLILPSE
jgi:signal transduction histidine kinase